MTLRLSAAFAVALAAAGLPAAVRAQDWSVSAVAGRTVNDPLAARVAAGNASLELRYSGAGDVSWAYASGGAPLGSAGPAWGAAGGGGLLAHAFGAARMGVRGGLDAYGYSADSGLSAGGGATVQLAPTLLLGRGPLRAELSAGGLGVLEQIGDSTSWRVMSDNGVRLVAGADRPLQVAAEGRYLRAREGGYAWAGGTATFSGARGSVWGFGGRWVTGGFPAPATGYGAGGTLRLGRGVEVGVSWAQEPTDPVYFTAARRSWSAQLTRRFGRAPAPAAAPAPLHPVAAVPVVPVAVDDRVELAVPAADAGPSPSVVGDFTQWQPVAMTRVGDRWTVRLPIQPGTYHYALQGPDGRIFVPASLPQVDDGFGGTSTVLVVR